MKKLKIGTIDFALGITEKDVKPWEMHSAKALKNAGYHILFVPAHNSIGSADAYLNGTLYEFKSPEGNRIKSIENNLQKALRKQSKYVVIDSYRVKNVRDSSIKNYLIGRMRRKRGIKNIIFISKKNEIIDIGELV